jgi:phosphatidylserine/phosphatidylglycerophosphate/cardiolipin synthase-like enzyme
MESIEIEQTKLFRQSFNNSLTRPCKLTIVSPFVTAIKPWPSVLAFATFFLRRHTLGLTLVTRPPGTASALLSQNEAEQLENMGVDLKIRSQPTLHSKIYLFEYEQGDYTAFIGSANFTQGGFSNNDETVTKFRTANEKSAILREVKRLNGHGAFPYHYWRKITKSRQGLQRADHE